MTPPRTIVLRLCGLANEGEWREVTAAPRMVAVTWQQHADDDAPVLTREVELVPTGNLEWDGNRCAEVWVPADALPLWRAEHDVDG